MSLNFNIYMHRNSENIHLKLIGDFDDSSANELIGFIEKNCKDVYKVYIHTNGLGKIDPFGCEIFQNNFKRLNSLSERFVFTGDNPIHMENIERMAS